MSELLARPQFPQLLLLFGGTLALVLGLLYFVSRFRAGQGNVADTSQLMTRFRDMHAQGALSDEEYRSIRTNLTARLQHELRDSNEGNKNNSG
jgi:hypothetical protein